MDVVRSLRDRDDLDLGETVRSFPRVRRWIATRVPDLDRQRLLDVLLVADALLTNAFEHAAGPRRLRLSRSQDRRVVRVEVVDASPQLLPVLGRPDRHGLRQRGLLLVNRLSVHWGVLPRHDHKRVWSEVAV